MVVSSSPTTYAVILIGLLSIMVAFFSKPQTELSVPSDARYRDATLSIDERVSDLLSHMTLEEKIGQIALVEKNSITPEDVRRFGIGAVLSGGGGKPENNTPLGWREMIQRYVDASRASRLGIPVFYGVDANHGHGNVPGATIFPHAIGLGATGNAELIENIARATAIESLATGSRWNFSPSLDLPRDIRWGRVYESFSDDPGLTGELGAAYIRGLHETAVLASAKHYLGAGGMLWNTSGNENFSIDQGVTPADEEALRTLYLPPFQRAIESGALNVMIGLNTWGDTKVSASAYLINDILKGELGFQGFVVSDWYGIYGISPDSYTSSVTAINAGMDMVMLPFDYEQFIYDVSKAVYRGQISEERIDDAASRILRAKFAFGLFDTEPALEMSVVGAPEHRALAREAVAQSLVILKNDGVLPLQRPRKIRIAGSAADNIGMQAGAWTYEWQGIDGNWLPGATSILAGIRAATPESSTIEFDARGVFSSTDRADIGIAIVGEKPYAEGWGDSANPTLSAEDLAAIDRLRAISEKLLVIIVSGRPLIISDQLESWDALIAAWLPGSEGAGVADVIFGTVTSSGTLPLPWPRSIDQLPLKTDGSTQGGTTLLFPRGFGL